MPEPFKNLFNENLIATMAEQLARASHEVGAPSFDEVGFREAAARGLEALELKERSAQIEAALTGRLPLDFPQAAAVLRASLHPEVDADLADVPLDDRGLRGWAILPMSQYVARYGLDDFELALDLLKDMTQRFSSEFAIRSFLLNGAERTLVVLQEWVRDPNPHVRRLVSEGTRPRLPWAMRLPAFIQDPSPVLPLLETLKDDPSEYVRRSVANNLNDISKDHPDRVAQIAHRWLINASKDRRRLVRHALRTLLKKGHPVALAALGYGPPKVKLQTLDVLTPLVRLGGELNVRVALQSKAKVPQSLMIDYVIHHRRANGSTSPKVFKWKALTLGAGETHAATRRHPMRVITTRKYYSGTHFLELQVNGCVLGRGEFELEI